MSEKLQIKPGYVVISTTRATGGVSYTRQHGTEEPEGVDGIRQEIASIKRVDHREAVETTRKVARRAEYLIRTRCAAVAFGFYATPEACATLAIDLAELAAEVDAANDLASRVGSDAHVYVGMMPVEIDVSNGDCVREIYRTLRTGLGEIRAALVAGDAHDLKLALDRAARLDSLAVGLAGEAIRAAIESAREARSEISKVDRARESGAAVETAAEVAARMTETYSGAVDTALAWVSDDGIGA